MKFDERKVQRIATSRQMESLRSYQVAYLPIAKLGHKWGNVFENDQIDFRNSLRSWRHRPLSLALMRVFSAFVQDVCDRLIDTNTRGRADLGRICWCSPTLGPVCRRPSDGMNPVSNPRPTRL